MTLLAEHPADDASAPAPRERRGDTPPSPSPQGRDSLGSPAPQQGVIEEARRRKRERRLRWAAVVLALASLAALAVSLTFAGGRARAPEAPLHLPAEATGTGFAHLDGAKGSVPVRVSPNLNGAEAGWCVDVFLRGVVTGGCAPLPTATTLVLSDSTSWGAGEREDTTVALTAPRVRSVEFSDGRRRPALPAAGLPYGMRVAVLRTPHDPRLSTVIRSVAVFDAAGRRLIEHRVAGSGLQWRIWNPPAPPADGACRLRVSGSFPARTEWGQVAASVHPYPAAIAGRGFLSCIDTEYYVPGRGLRASVLLDAQAPGRTAPAAIPGVTPIPGLPGLFNTSSGAGTEPLTARREGSSWLVVAGGGRGAEEARVRLLEHLRVQVDR